VPDPRGFLQGLRARRQAHRGQQLRQGPAAGAVHQGRELRDTHCDRGPWRPPRARRVPG